jgi:uncharacterized protein YjbJ (UPF0337 family)
MYREHGSGRCFVLSKDEAKGKAKQAEGKAQEEWGKLKKKVS